MVDPAGRPLERRREQAIMALGVVTGWLALLGFVLWLTGGDGTSSAPAWCLAAIAFGCWFAAEEAGRKRGLVWPASAFGIVGSLSLGLGASIATPELRTAPTGDGIAIISAVSAISMAIYLFRFRLPGLVSPVVTFTVVAVFLGLHGTDPESVAKIEGFSPRGILAALLDNPFLAGVVGSAALIVVGFARRLDLKGDDFGLATARPLHLIGAGIAALVIGRMLGALPVPLDIVALGTAWIGALIWALRINRVAVVCTIHFAIARPAVLAVAEPLGLSLSVSDWSLLLTTMLIFDLAIWPLCHKLSLRHGWTLGPGGRIPRERKGWVWRYWPYVSADPPVAETGPEPRTT